MAFSALAAVIVAADLRAVARGAAVSETKTGPLVEAVDGARQTPHPVGAKNHQANDQTTSEMRQPMMVMMLLSGDSAWADMLLRK